MPCALTGDACEQADVFPRGCSYARYIVFATHLRFVVAIEGVPGVLLDSGFVDAIIFVDLAAVFELREHERRSGFFSIDFQFELIGGKNH